MDWMAISGYRLPQQLQNNSSTNQQVNELLKTNLNQARDNSNSVVANSANSDSATSTMLDMWAASKIEAASNSNSSSNLGGGAPPTPPITVERSAIVGQTSAGGTGSQTAGQGGISASQASGSISTPGSIKGLNFTILFKIRRAG